jgi:hypothetical protein
MVVQGSRRGSDRVVLVRIQRKYTGGSRGYHVQKVVETPHTFHKRRVEQTMKKRWESWSYMVKTFVPRVFVDKDVHRDRQLLPKVQVDYLVNRIRPWHEEEGSFLFVV